MEGSNSTEVAHDIARHQEHTATRTGQSDRLLSVAEAVLLAIVALTGAWSGFGAAKWSTESRVKLAESATTRSQANRAQQTALEFRNFDSSTFSAWYAAYSVGNQTAMDVAARRFRPEFKVAFDAWLATSPATNPNAPPGPTFMPEYVQPDLERAQQLDDQADQQFRDGESAGSTSDDYIRVVLFLASVLFIVGISTQFAGSGVRYGLVGLGVVLLAGSLVSLSQLPRPPG